MNVFRHVLSYSLDLRYEQEQPIIYFYLHCKCCLRRRVWVSKHFNKSDFSPKHIKKFSAKDSGQQWFSCSTNVFISPLVAWQAIYILEKRCRPLFMLFTLFLYFAVNEFFLSLDFNNWRMFFLNIIIHWMVYIKRFDSQKYHAVPFPWPLLM